MLPSVCLKQQQQQQRINGTDLKLKNRPTQTGSIDFDKGTKRFSEEKTDFAAHGTTAIEHPEAKKKKKEPKPKPDILYKNEFKCKMFQLWYCTVILYSVTIRGN